MTIPRALARLALVPLLVIPFIRLGHASLWDDEGFSIAAAHLSWGELSSFTLERDPHTGLFHSMLKGWLAIGGDGEAWARSLPAFLAVLAVPFLWLTLRRLFSDRIATATSALLVSNGFFLAYAQEVRPYALALMLTCASMYLAVRAVQGNAWIDWIGWAVTAALSIYAHPFAAGPVCAALLATAFSPNFPKLIHRGAIAVAALSVLVAPAVYLYATAPPSSLSWLPGVTLSSVSGSAHQLTGHGGPVMTALVGILVLAFAVGVVATFRSRPRSDAAYAEVLVLGWALLLPVAAVAISFVKPTLVPRYLLPALPGVLAAAVIAVTRIERERLQLAVGGALALCAAVSVGLYFGDNAKDNWRAATAHIIENRRGGDAVVITHDQRNVFEYYFMRAGGDAGQPPEPISPLRPWGSDIAENEVRLQQSTAVDVERAIDHYQRVWLLYRTTDPALPAGFIEGVNLKFHEIQRESFDPRIAAVLYERR